MLSEETLPAVILNPGRIVLQKNFTDSRSWAAFLPDCSELLSTVAAREYECDMLFVSKGGRHTMEKAHALVMVRDINLVCQHYKTYAQIEG